MSYIVIATTDDVQTSSAQTLINANNYTNTAIPEQIQEVLLPLLPARPDQVSNVTWDFKTTTVDADGNEVKKWEHSPTIEYVDQSANISLDICKTLVSSGKAEAVTASNAYTDLSVSGILNSAKTYTDNATNRTLNISKNYTDQNFNLLKNIVEAMQISQYLSEEDIMDAMDRIDLL